MDIILDFETKSGCDIARGVDSYATDPAADILCAVVMDADPDKNEVFYWTPTTELSTGFIDLIQNADRIWAHNARFDQGIWELIGAPRYGCVFPEILATQWYCSMHLARLNGLPAALDKACRAAQLPGQKHKAEGDRLIRKMCIPHKATGQFEWSRALLSDMVNYCIADVLATKGLILACIPMSHADHTDWLINEQINDRGVLIDMPLAVAAAAYVEAEKAEISTELSRLTKGEISSAQQHQRFTKYVMARAPQAEKYMRKYDNGVAKLSLDKEHLNNLLTATDAGQIDLPDEVYNALQCKVEAGGAATAKFKRMIVKADDDGRVRGEFICFGASTGRYTSRGIQFHNFKRDCFSATDAEVLRSMMLSGQVLNGAVIPTLGKMLRPTLIPAPDHLFVVGDWSQVENRALPYLAHSMHADKKLELFRDIDADPSRDDTYVIAARSAGLDDRQIGKVIELSLGYLGGVGAFSSMAKVYGVNLPRHKIEAIIAQWRVVNRWAVIFGAQLTKAAMRAIRDPQTYFKAGLVVYRFEPRLLGGTLTCCLPCGTELRYVQARIEAGKYGPEITALKANILPTAEATEWPRYKLWAGVLMENCTQAFCASLLRDLLTRIDGAILHCHDEVALEVLRQDASAASEKLQQEMERPPPWAYGLPLKAAPVILTRYGKP